MINNKTYTALDFDKILNMLQKYAVLEDTKNLILNTLPSTDYETCKTLLNYTEEAYKLFYTHGICQIEYCDKLTDELERAKRGAVLTFSELLKVARLLRSLRILATSIDEIVDNDIVLLKDLSLEIFYNFAIEREIFTKIINEDTISDNASEKLFIIRQNIKNINERIRERLSQLIKKDATKYLQSETISIRNGRYVLPVKTENRSQVKGFIHDRSQSGSTLFIEPTEILELNNDLRNEILEEQAEIERILTELSLKVAQIADKLNASKDVLVKFDLIYSKAQFAFNLKATKPILTSNGEIDIKYGRHPLIAKNQVVPVSINLGTDYNYILITGPNTGGKTVTLKLIGLFTLMSMSGMFIPAFDNSKISVFNKIFVDIGDEQSIEQSLSTFSSHLKNIINITESVDSNSLVLIDEIGAGTDPEEGSALAKSILNHLIEKGSFGVVTTHYTALKEYALTNDNIVNASMDFDVNTFKPLYKIKIGYPGSSNAIEIAKRLGLSTTLYENAKQNLTESKRNFDNIILEAEKVRFEAEKDKEYIEKLKEESQKTYDTLIKEKEKFENDKKTFIEKAKLKAQKLFNDKLEKAEEMLSEMKEIFAKDEYNKSDLVKMATLKNNIYKESDLTESEQTSVTLYKKVDINKLKNGDVVFVSSLNSQGVVDSVSVRKNTVWVIVGQVKFNAKIDELFFVSDAKKPSKKQTEYTFKRAQSINVAITELNVIGKNVDDALFEVDAFLDKSVLSSYEEVRIVHGKGLKILANNIHSYLKNDKRVKSYRFGKYGEGEDGVTIVTLN